MAHCGVPACLPAAPEVLSNGRTYDGTKCDVWSSAVMLYVMLFCEYPFERPEDEQHPHKFQKMLERTKRLDYRLGSPSRKSLQELPTAHCCTEKMCHAGNLLHHGGSSAHLGDALDVWLPARSGCPLQT